MWFGSVLKWFWVVWVFWVFPGSVFDAKTRITAVIILTDFFLQSVPTLPSFENQDNKIAYNDLGYAPTFDINSNTPLLHSKWLKHVILCNNFTGRISVALLCIICDFSYPIKQR